MSIAATMAAIHPAHGRRTHAVPLIWIDFYGSVVPARFRWKRRINITDLIENARSQYYDIAPLKGEFVTDIEFAEATKKDAHEERRFANRVVKRLIVIERRKIWAKMGYGSLREFVTKYLGYDEGGSTRHIGAMHLVRENPQTQVMLEAGELSLTSASMLNSFFYRNPDITRSEVIENARGKSVREVERQIVTLEPDRIRPEKVRPITETHTEIRIVMDEKLKMKLDKLKALRSHKNPSMTYAELIEDMAKLAESKWDPTLKKSRGVPSAPAKRTRKIASATKSQVWKNDDSRCGWTDPKTGRRCNSTHLLEVDHIIPWSQGGTNDIDNLRLLCRAHNQLRNEPR